MSYKSVLKQAMKAEEEVTIDRDGAPSLTGQVESVDESGLTLKAISGTERASFTLIEFTNIRGVTTTGWDMDAIVK